MRVYVCICMYVRTWTKLRNASTFSTSRKLSRVGVPPPTTTDCQNTLGR